MVPFHLQIELESKQTTLMVEQLDPLADATGFMRYQVGSFHRGGVIFVNIEDGLLPAEEPVGYSLDEAFTLDEVISIRCGDPRIQQWPQTDLRPDGF